MQEQLNKQLFVAAKAGDLNQVKEMIKAGANVNAITFGRTPLIAASEYGNKEIVEFLLQKGADVNAKDLYGWTSLSRCLLGGRLENDDEALAIGKILVNYILIKNPERKNEYSFSGQRQSNGITIRNVPKISEYWDECQSEVHDMQKEKIGNSNVSLYQFLSETNENKLACYLSNQNTGVREELKVGLYTERYNWVYPLYASMIESQYSKGMERKDLLSKAEIVLKHSDFKVLSEDARNKVANFLTNTTLVDVRKAGINAKILTLN